MEAFEYYYSLGIERSLRKVAAKYGISEQTVFKWNKKNNWQARVAERDRVNLLKLEAENNEKIINTMKIYKSVIKSAIKQFVKNLQANKVDLTSAKDLSTLVHLDIDVSKFMVETTDKNLERNEELAGISPGAIASACSQSMNTVTKIMAEASRFGGLDDIDEDMIEQLSEEALDELEKEEQETESDGDDA